MAKTPTTYVTTSKQYEQYGRFTFITEQTLKWNYVFRIWPELIIKAENGITSGTKPMNEIEKDYTFPLYLVIGTKSECLIALQTLASNNLI